MSETAKERIKRKKKERAEAMLNNKIDAPAVADLDANGQPLQSATTTVEDLPLKDGASKPPIEVLGIYPANQPKKKFIAHGSVKIKMHQIGLEIRNIPYAVCSGNNVRIQAPFRYYRFPDDPDKEDEYVESIAFDDKALWKAACKVIRTAVLEHHREELPIKEEEKPEIPAKEEGPAECTKE